MDYVDIGLGHGQAFDLETPGSLYERAKVILADGDLPPVHVHQQLLHVPGGHTVQVDDVVLLLVPVLRQEGPEVGAADGQHEGVGGEQLVLLIVPTGKGHVSELLPHDQLLHQQEEGLVVVVPFQQELVFCRTHCNHRLGTASLRSCLISGAFVLVSSYS